MKLVENTLTEVRIIEANKDSLPEGVLLRCAYPICNVDKLNANNRVYGRDVWEKVIGDKAIQEKMSNRALFGQAEHPAETQSDLQLTSHVIHDMWIDESSNRVFQKVDILDTPTGRIIETLFKAGCKVGMSTRADGDLEEYELDEGGKKTPCQRVIADSYRYVTTDFTADPSTFGVLPENIEMATESIKAELKNTKLKEGERRFVISLIESMEKKEDKTEVKEFTVKEAVDNKILETGRVVRYKDGDAVITDINENITVEYGASGTTITQLDMGDRVVVNFDGTIDIFLASQETDEQPKEPLPEEPVDTGVDTPDIAEPPVDDEPENNPVESKDIKEQDEFFDDTNVDLVALYKQDGYLVRAAYGTSEVWQEKYWPEEWRKGPFYLIKLKNVPKKIADKLVRQTSSEQYYDDGYEAANAAGPYVVDDTKREYNEDSVDEGNIRHVSPGVYRVSFYDGTSVEIDAESAVDAKTKAEAQEDKRAINCQKIKATGEEQDIAVESIKESEDKNRNALESFKDKDGDTVFILPDVIFTKNIEDTINDALDKGYEEFLYGELGSGEGISNADKTKIWWGADVQDFLPNRNNESKVIKERRSDAIDDMLQIVEDGWKESPEYVKDQDFPDEFLYQMLTEDEGLRGYIISAIQKRKSLGATRESVDEAMSSDEFNKRRLEILDSNESDTDKLKKIVNLYDEKDRSWNESTKSEVKTEAKEILKYRVEEAKTRAERDKAFELVEKLSESGSIRAIEVKAMAKKFKGLLEKTDKTVQSLCRKLEEKASTAKQLKKEITDTKVHFQKEAIKLKEQHETQVKEVEKSLEKKINKVEKTFIHQFIEMRLTESNLKVDPNTRTLLEKQGSFDDVDNILDDLRDIGAFNALHSSSLKEAKIENEQIVSKDDLEKIKLRSTYRPILDSMGGKRGSD